MTVETGTIIHGTLRNQDIGPALADYLVNMGGNGIVPLHLWPKLDKTANRLCEDVDRINNIGNDDAWFSEEGSEIVAELFEVIDEFLPDGYYCGSTEGDGSDFGVWEIEKGD